MRPRVRARRQDARGRLPRGLHRVLEHDVPPGSWSFTAGPPDPRSGAAPLPAPDRTTTPPAAVAAVAACCPPPVESPLTLAELGAPRAAFVVPGRPAPQGSKKRVTGKDGKVRLVEMSKRVKPWRDAIQEAFTAVRPAGWVPLDGPVVLDVVFTMPRPLDRPKTLRVFPDVSPDLDKLVRATLDGLTKAGVIGDDKLVVGFRRLEAFYSGDPDADALASPGAVIRAWVRPIVPLTLR